ncbi:MAG: hypothetical protein E7E64_01460 [Clostridium celatum]|nr:hypothetical protein [Clostridium celatum]MDU4978244.1 hypothetical protein [Clostridium celatum]
MGIKINGKKRIIIGATIGIVLTIIATLGICTSKLVNAKKISDSIELGIKHLTEENYDEAKAEFSKTLSIDEEHEEASELLTLTEECIELNDLCENKEYILASELIEKINKNEYLELIKEKIDNILGIIKDKIRIIDEIDNIEAEINHLTSENKYDEAIELVNNYLSEELKDEYLDKLNNLKDSISNSKIAYEEEQRIAEEQRLEEERKAEEQRRLEEQQSAEVENQNQTSTGTYQMISKDRVKEILDGKTADMGITFENYDRPIVFEKNGIVYWAYKQIWQGESGTFLIIDMFTGKVIVSEKLDFVHGDADFYYPGY